MPETEVINEEGQRAKTDLQDSQSQDQSLRTRRCAGLAEKKDTSGILVQTRTSFRTSFRTSPSNKEVPVGEKLIWLRITRMMLQAYMCQKHCC